MENRSPYDLLEMTEIVPFIKKRPAAELIRILAENKLQRGGDFLKTLIIQGAAPSLVDGLQALDLYNYRESMKIVRLALREQRLILNKNFFVEGAAALGESMILMRKDASIFNLAKRGILRFAFSIREMDKISLIKYSALSLGGVGIILLCIRYRKELASLYATLETSDPEIARF